MKREVICGIYKITSPSKKVYIGQSIDIIKRWSYYKCLNCKKQNFLYHSFKKYGVEKHEFEILCQCSKEELNNLESYYIELYNSFNSEYGLNLSSGGEYSKMSDLTRVKISNANRGKKRSLEVRQKMSLSRKGVPLGIKRSDATKLKVSIGNTGKKRSPEICKMQGDIRRGKVHKKMTQETKDRLKGKGAGRKVTEQHRLNMSLAKKGTKRTPEAIEKSASFHRGRKRSEEQKKKISDSIKKKYESPEYRFNQKYGRKSKIKDGAVTL